MTPTVKRPELASAKKEPDFATEAEAAAWYDAHDTSELQGEEITHVPAAPEQERLREVAVRVSHREIVELKRRAARLGIGYTTYVRMLINRHVLNEPPLG